MISGINLRALIFRFGMPLLLLLAASVTRAETPAWDVPQLMQSLAQVKQANNKFTEHKYLSMLDKPLVSSGKLAYRAPGHLEKRTLSPKPEAMILDGDSLSVDIKGKRRTLTLQYYPLLWAFVESIRATLAGDLPALQRFYRVTLEGDAGQWQLLLMPTDPEVRNVVREIRISGKRNRLLTIEVFEIQGDHSLMTISEDDA